MRTHIRRLLLIPDPVDGQGSVTPPAPAPSPAPGPSAVIVSQGKTEAEIDLERQLAEEREGRRTAEFKAAEEERKRQEAEDRLLLHPKPARRPKRVGCIIRFEDDEEEGQ